MIKVYVFLRTKLFLSVSILFFLLLQTAIIAQPDLLVVESTLVNSLRVANLNNPDQCMVDEGCIAGLGARQLIRFSTHIKNIGNQDFYVGSPPNSPAQANDQWEWDDCHNHWHYEGYAEYLVFDEFGNNTPIGVKNGFCLIDIECSGGGNFTYTCGNQGISAGCGDIYGSGLDCQWVDITDIPDGIYTLVIRVNWDRSPDANGLLESTYDNNSTEVCFELTRNAQNTASIQLLQGPCAFVDDCNEATLTINLDNYPEETSWKLHNDNDVQVAGGNHYDIPGTGSTVSEILCLPDGCYTLTMEDSQGDGLCCNFGQGSYQLTDGSGTVLVSGAEFGFTETMNFCIQPTPPCTDEDNDGLCASEDCNDNDDTLPAPPGVACNDNDPNTENDVIQADGCSCAGTPVTTDPCEAITIISSDNQIEIQNVGGFPHMNIQIFNHVWNRLDVCVDDCGNPYLLTDLAPGIYYVSIKPFDAAWDEICDIYESVEVTGSTGPCTDADGDGYCMNDDCDDNNPNLPAAPGTSCDDQNANTENDEIQADGCSCEGTVIMTGDCAVIGIESIPGGINITGTGNFPLVVLQVFDGSWDRIVNCSGVCNSPYVITDLDPGTYYVSIKTHDASWQRLCDVFLEIDVTGQSGPCTDADNDGVCVNDDCDDNDPNFPLAPGSSCNDGDANTLNDQIQADGCTCEGTPPDPPSDCNDITVVAGLGTITVSNHNLYPGSSVQIQTSDWNQISFCFTDCTDPLIETGLPAGEYLVTLKIYDENWDGLCRIDERVTVLENTMSGNIQFRSSPFEFDAHIFGAESQLNWLVTNEYLTNRFELERSVDGSPYQLIEKRNKLGVSENEKIFESRDALTKTGHYTYRVKQIFSDGSWRYSSEKSIDFNADDLVQVFPNPADQKVFVDLSRIEAGVKGKLTLNAIGGQVLFSENLEDINAGLYELESAKLQSGVYLLFIDIDGKKPMAKKIIISH